MRILNRIKIENAPGMGHFYFKFFPADAILDLRFQILDFLKLQDRFFLSILSFEKST
jgi:hypothetical protein